MGLFFETCFLEWLSVFVVLCTSVWFYFKSKYNYWRRKGVRFIPPVIPFGNIKDIVLLRKPSTDVVKEFYDAFPEERFVGLYEIMNPLILIRDPELIKHVMVKDFSHFQDRSLQSREELGPLNAHLFNLTGKRWRNLRTRLTPTFTSGKMKMMFDLMLVCAHQLKEYLEKASQKDEMLEMKEVMAKFTTDVIGLCAFGLQSNAISDSDSEFRQMGRQVFLSSPLAAVRGLLELTFPSLLKIFRIKAFPDKVSNFFIRTVKDVIEFRETNNVSRNDFMQLIIELKNKGKVHDDEPAKSEDALDGSLRKASENNIEFTDNLLASQAFIFFVAGFETSSSALSFCLHELSIHPEIQERLRNEIDFTLEKCEGKLTYDAVQSMSYIDQVLAETLRKYPPLPAIFRVVTKPYVLPGTSVHLDVGMKVMIPIYGLHNDPKYFPEPEIFDPENFSDESKNRRPHNVYLSFGDGPRNCIGMRFGLLQAKLGLIFLLSNFKFSVGDKTQLPLKLDPKVLLTTSKSGTWLRINKRTDT